MATGPPSGQGPREQGAGGYEGVIWWYTLPRMDAIGDRLLNLKPFMAMGSHLPSQRRARGYRTGLLPHARTIPSC